MGMTSKPSKYEIRKPAAPVWFVDPTTGETLELDLNTAAFTPRAEETK